MLEWIVGMTLWTAALLLVAVIADRLLARRVRPAWRVLLFCTVFVRLALPVDWQSPLGVLSFDEPRTDAAIDYEIASAPVASTPAPALPSRAWSPFAIAYAGGVLLLLSWLAVAKVRLSRRLATASPARPRVAALARGVDIREHATEGPLTYGVWRSTIVLPRALVDMLDDEALHHVVAHELAHVRRRDPALVQALSIAVACAWPILPAWLAAARIRQLVEQAADDHCLTRGGVASARAYGRTLLALAEHQRTAALVLEFGGFRALRERIAALTSRRRAAPAIQLVAIAGIGAGALACTGVAAEPDASAQAERCAALRDDATGKHDASERANDDAMRLAAAAAYDAYARECASHPDYEEILYYRAELLWAIAFQRGNAGDVAGERAGFSSAHAAFNEVLSAEPGRFTRDAAFAQMLAKRNELGADLEGPADSGREYSRAELEMLAAIDTFERHIADSTDVDREKARQHRAELALRRDRVDEARPILVELRDTAATSEVRDWAKLQLRDLDAPSR